MKAFVEGDLAQDLGVLMYEWVVLSSYVHVFLVQFLEAALPHTLRHLTGTTSSVLILYIFLVIGAVDYEQNWTHLTTINKEESQTAKEPDS